MIDHLLYNKAEWFNRDSDRLIPKKIKISPGAKLYEYSDFYNGRTPDATVDNKIAGVYDCTGKRKMYYYDASSNKNTYSQAYFVNELLAYDATGKLNEHTILINCVDANDPNITPIWGGRKDLLAHVYQAITSLFRRAVIA